MLPPPESRAQQTKHGVARCGSRGMVPSFGLVVFRIICLDSLPRPSGYDSNRRRGMVIMIFRRVIL